MKRVFRDRVEAGRLLARQLKPFARRLDTVVLALPRGGVPVGFEVAYALHLPLEVLIVRKLGVPGHQELAMGAVASGGAFYRNESVIASFQVTPREMEMAIHRESTELMRREQTYRGDRLPVQLEGRRVIIVDDGIATGSTVRAAVRAIAASRPKTIVVAAPVIGAATAGELRAIADKVVAVMMPADLGAIGQYYAEFRQTSDDEVRALLARCTIEGGCPEAGETKVGPGRNVRLQVERRLQGPPRWAWHFRTLVLLRNHLRRGRSDSLRHPGEAMLQPGLPAADLIDPLYDRDLALALPANTEEALREVDAAILRIEQGTYGICEATGRRIANVHLRTVPWRRFAPGALDRPRMPMNRMESHAILSPAS